MRLRDVALIGRGARTIRSTRLHGKRRRAWRGKLAPGANAWIQPKRCPPHGRLAPCLPNGPKLIYPYDTTPFVSRSSDEVVRRCSRHLCLCLLGDVPLPAELPRHGYQPSPSPLCLLATFGILAAAGFSINTLTMSAWA